MRSGLVNIYKKERLFEVDINSQVKLSRTIFRRIGPPPQKIKSLKIIKFRNLRKEIPKIGRCQIKNDICKRRKEFLKEPMKMQTREKMG